MRDDSTFRIADVTSRQNFFHGLRIAIGHAYPPRMLVCEGTTKSGAGGRVMPLGPVLSAGSR